MSDNDQKNDLEFADISAGLCRGLRFANLFALALGHDGLWVFANRILANRIFADRVLANWRRHRRGWLLARQIGGSGNAHHGDEPSRYDYDDLHDC